MAQKLQLLWRVRKGNFEAESANTRRAQEKDHPRGAVGEDLLALKEIHCARVAEEEDELFSLLRFPGPQEERRISHLREILGESYTSYEALLQAAVPTRSTSAVLAHRILLADAYFFHARVEGRSVSASESAQQRLYRRSIDVYSDLLELAKRSLTSTDDSLLCIVEKISQILRESHIHEPVLVVEITTLLDRAESGRN
ncbi:hypothetical protein ANCCAN_12346 [Ancylostoma caninum]|uniref:14-3-3 domain-containing protein n=1 Tax=Ancylostoma caninum TaxID=29170 RepID=A0A368GFS4_ANCCA|nr:hypothetical protein ANCCAN_12346 [Ancylostoma caninum]